MKIQAIFNRDGGTFRTTDMEAYCAKAQEVFTAAGHDLTCLTVDGSEMPDALEKTSLRDDLDAMIAGGGDGTISSAAAIAWKHGMPLGVVPAGTMNLFARSLKLPLDIWQVLPVLADGRIIDADIGSANGRAFVHQFSTGLHARMVRYRESYTFASRIGKISASTRAAIGVIFNPPEFLVDINVDGVRERRKISAISVSNNHFGRDKFMYADDVTGGHLGFYTAQPLKPLGVTRLAFDIFRGKFRDSAAITEMSGEAVDLHFPKVHGKINCVIDGELLPLDHDVSLRIHPGELKLLVGKEETAA
ncbi:diacylglycerol/lipid kinase family protein [Pararhizobium sp.]|uniref:diacylglycerol/lipid kinase family protein n=1 Tax=Pararhizobium sp. TaxID=1977563 RepID=UPI0027218212|nr:diacylglycerol kinase family protein [Pararhizobium sp.]MDO9418015.1 diacylglycerol kinase family lipid kinase [Pararhizobium sp.]